MGLRLEAEGRGVDVALVGAWMRSRRPLPQLDPGLRRALQTETLPGLADQQALLDSLADPISARWPRSALAGAEVATTLGPLGLRVEGLWSSDKVLLQRWLRGQTRPALATGLGLDRAFGTRLQLLVELRHEHIFDAPSDMLLSLPDELQIAGGARLALAGERLFIEPGALASLPFGEVASRLALRWRIVDAWELSAGALRVDAPRVAPRSLQEALVFSGGPLGALADTDNLWMGLRWIR